MNEWEVMTGAFHGKSDIFLVLIAIFLCGELKKSLLRLIIGNLLRLKS